MGVAASTKYAYDRLKKKLGRNPTAAETRKIVMRAKDYFKDPNRKTEMPAGWKPGAETAPPKRPRLGRPSGDAKRAYRGGRGTPTAKPVPPAKPRQPRDGPKTPRLGKAGGGARRTYRPQPKPPEKVRPQPKPSTSKPRYTKTRGASSSRGIRPMRRTTRRTTRRRR